MNSDPGNSQSMNAASDSQVRDVAAAFDGTTNGYGTRGDFHQRHAEQLVAYAEIRPGETVLDVATGTAPAAIAAANRVGRSGCVIGVDISPGMLGQARRNLVEGRSGTISLACANGANLPFRDCPFDVVLCSSSLVWFADIPNTLREWARVTKPGGRLAFSCLAAGALPLGRLFRTHLASHGVDFPDLNEPLDTAEKCRRVLGRIGYSNVAC